MSSFQIFLARAVCVLLMVLVVVGFPGGADASDLAGSEWGLRKPPERFIQFQATGQVSGTGGCNRFFGSYTVSGNKLSVGPLASTRILCASPIMKAERQFHKKLEDTASFRRSSAELSLFDEEGAELMVLDHRDWD